MKKRISLFLCFALMLSLFNFTSFASTSDDAETSTPENDSAAEETLNPELASKVKSAVLMEASTGKILYAKNPTEMLPPASVTKIMTLLIISEAINEGKINLNDKVTVSANAASMGGSQIFIKEGEIFTVEELIKCTVIASANDAAVALAELLAGSEESFVNMMNLRAKELKMVSTVFENCTGLDDTVTKHLTSSQDIAIMSRELIKHDIILKYSNVWQDSIRNGEFILTNTNRLVRYYEGCTGLKTGSTSKAGFCLSATAKRNGMHLISVVMGANTRDDRNQVAKSMLDYGFANFSIYREEEKLLENAPLHYGKKVSIDLYSKPIEFLLNKGDIKKIEITYNIPEFVNAPIETNSIVGNIVYSVNGKEIAKSDIIVKESMEKVGIGDMIFYLFKWILVGK